MKKYNDPSQYSELAIFECGKEECVKNKAICLTKKDYHLFHYVLYGKGTLVINRVEYRLTKGSIFFIGANSDAIYFPDKEDPWIYEWVGFKGSKADEILESLGIDGNHPIILDKKNKYKQYFDAIIRRYVDYSYIDLTSLGALYQLFGEMIYDKEGETAMSKPYASVQLAKDFIKNNYQFNITVEDIAKNANATPNYLSNIFQKEEGMTTKKYLTKIRMERAVTLLQNKRMKIKDISKLVGYPNQLHFSNEFKKYYGVSPITFSKEVLNK